ncbi:MAG: methylmalonyl-CoA mutase family protein [Bacteriovoracaceae bacterium]|jgi:methylmalonyl-CoA mutase|nr:methylmalonyl-CoA mutase family protein [Bacteriovoracaceae bacterium]
MNINEVKNFNFESVGYTDWMSLIDSQLKDSDKRKIQVSTLEGIDHNILETKTDWITNLNSFCTNPKFSLLSSPSKDLKDDSLVKDLGADLYERDFHISAFDLHNAGGCATYEIAYLLKEFENCSEKHINVELAVDSLTYLNIAKMRAIRFLLESYIDQNNLDTSFSLIAINSLRETTIFDPWNNMLRSTSAAASSMIAGADRIVISSYDYAFSILNNKDPKDLAIRSAINTLNVLSDESFLTKVADPCKGSYAIESLTKVLIDNSLEVYKKNLSDADFSNQAKENFDKRIKKINKRSLTMAGLNNFVNTTEDIVSLYDCNEINVTYNDDSNFPLRRLAQGFEKLRLDMSLKQLKLDLVCFGKEASLSARINFCKNYFETASIEVNTIITNDMDELAKLLSREGKLLCLCATDEDLEKLKLKSNYRMNFISGNGVNKDGFKNIFMGQDVFSTLEEVYNEI